MTSSRWIPWIAILLLLSACTAGKFEEARKKNTIEAYDAFLKKHPKGEEAKKAKGLREDKWYSDAKAANTLRAYSEYLQEYPKGRYVKQAKARRERARYEEARRRNLVGGYNIYLREYPQGRYVQEVLALREEAWFYSLQQAPTLETIDAFLRAYPYGRYANGVWQMRDILEEEAIFQSAMELNTEEAYQEYIAIYPDGQYTQLAEQRSLIAKETRIFEEANSLEDYQSYLNEYWKGQYRAAAKAEIRKELKTPFFETDPPSSYLQWMIYAMQFYQQQETPTAISTFTSLSTFIKGHFAALPQGVLFSEQERQQLSEQREGTPRLFMESETALNDPNTIAYYQHAIAVFDQYNAATKTAQLLLCQGVENLSLSSFGLIQCASNPRQYAEFPLESGEAFQERIREIAKENNYPLTPIPPRSILWKFHIEEAPNQSGSVLAKALGRVYFEIPPKKMQQLLKTEWYEDVFIEKDNQRIPGSYGVFRFTTKLKFKELQPQFDPVSRELIRMTIRLEPTAICLHGLYLHRELFCESL